MRKNNKYSKDFKLKVIDEYLKGGFSLQEVVDKFEIRSKTQVHSWLQKYKICGEHAFDFETRGVKKKIISEDLNFNNLKDELLSLKMENEYLKNLYNMRKNDSKQNATNFMSYFQKLNSEEVFKKEIKKNLIIERKRSKNYCRRFSN